MPPEPVCSGGPTQTADGEGQAARMKAPPSVSSWRSRALRHAMNRRAVDWAKESPQRCEGTIARGAP